MQAIRTPRKRLAQPTQAAERNITNFAIQQAQSHHTKTAMPQDTLKAAPTSLLQDKVQMQTHPLLQSHAVHAFKCSVRLMHSDPCRP